MGSVFWGLGLHEFSVWGLGLHEFSVWGLGLHGFSVWGFTCTVKMLGWGAS